MILLLAASVALGADIRTYPSCARVKAVAFVFDTAVAVAEDGACRYALDGSKAEVLEAAELAAETAKLGDCEYVPQEDGLLRRCAHLSDEVLPAGGFPVTSAAAYNGVVYAGTFGGGLRRMPSGDRVAGVPDAVTALAGSSRGLLVGTDRGLFIYEGGRVRGLAAAGPGDGHVVKLVRAGKALWAAHFDRGLSRLENGVWRHFTVADGLSSDWVDDIVWDGERLWGAGERGVFYVEDGIVKRPEDFRLRRPTTALAVSSGTILLGQAGRVVAWKNGVFRETVVAEQHPQRLLAHGETIWLAGLDGLWKLDGAEVERYGVIDGRLPGDWVTALNLAPEGLLVGTYDAGLKLLGSSATLKADAWVNPGALDRDGAALAVGENGAGLALWNGSAWSRLGTVDGLPGEDVSAVLFDGPHLWVGTRTGLARVTKGTVPFVTF